MFWSILVAGILVGTGDATLPSLERFLRAIPNPVNRPPFFHSINHPISMTPTTILKTKFFLYTPTNPTEEELLEPTLEVIQNSSFNRSLPVKVLIHGYRSGLDENDIRFQIKDALLNASDYNILVVNWTEHNGPPYLQAVANARAVGEQLAHLLKFIIENTGIRAENIHIIGHSLGGHMAGWTGRMIPKLGRITGLDPAGPYFQDVENQTRLNASDALFVDVIHTDIGENVVAGFGIDDPVGHMDFYPNGGRRQPGCVYTSSKDNVVGGIINVTTDWLKTSCDHRRANKYFLESIDNSKCRFLAVSCESYDDFEKGDCLPQNSTLSEMGFHAKRIPGVPKSKFFLRTNGSPPFCIENSIDLKQNDKL